MDTQPEWIILKMDVLNRAWKEEGGPIFLSRNWLDIKKYLANRGQMLSKEVILQFLEKQKSSSVVYKNVGNRKLKETSKSFLRRPRFFASLQGDLIFLSWIMFIMYLCFCSFLFFRCSFYWRTLTHVASRTLNHLTALLDGYFKFQPKSLTFCDIFDVVAPLILAPTTNTIPGEATPECHTHSPH